MNGKFDYWSPDTEFNSVLDSEKIMTCRFGRVICVVATLSLGIALPGLSLAQGSPGSGSSTDSPARGTTEYYKKAEADFASSMQIYLKEKACETPALQSALSANLQLDADPRYFEPLLEMEADNLITLGDIAAFKGCVAIARDQYVSVMRRFVGSAYASYRERSKLAIEDLKDNKSIAGKKVVRH